MTEYFTNLMYFINEYYFAGEEQAQEEENGKMQKAVERKKLDAIKADTRKLVAEIKETERAEVRLSSSRTTIQPNNKINFIFKSHNFFLKICN
tara:strand:- start:1257 stop:1535 length:279 start_codon:yes stop_codon:yes gene_type:complete